MIGPGSILLYIVALLTWPIWLPIITVVVIVDVCRGNPRSAMPTGGPWSAG